MVETLRTGVQSASENCTEDPIPPLTQAVDEKDGWITFDKPVLYVYAGQGPYVGRYAATSGSAARATHEILLATLCSSLCLYRTTD